MILLLACLLSVSAGFLEAHKLAANEDFAAIGYSRISALSPELGSKYVDQAKSLRNKRASDDNRPRVYTWRILSYPELYTEFQNITQEFEEIVVKGFKLWTDVANFTARKAEPEEDANIVFVSRYIPGDNVSILLETSPLHWEIVMNNRSTFCNSITNVFKPNDEHSLLYSTSHNIGHAIGLGHLNSPETLFSIMYIREMLDRPGNELVLSQVDIDSVLKIYGPSEKYANRTEEEKEEEKNKIMSTMRNGMVVKQFVALRDTLIAKINKLKSEIEQATSPEEREKLKEEMELQERKLAFQKNGREKMFSNWMKPSLVLKVTLDELAMEGIKIVINEFNNDINKAEDNIKKFLETEDRNEQLIEDLQIEMNFYVRSHESKHYAALQKENLIKYIKRVG